jgi:hypothetical protein
LIVDDVDVVIRAAVDGVELALHGRACREPARKRGTRARV